MSKALKKLNRGAKPEAPRIARTRGHDWQLQTAKAKFSEVFRRARTEGHNESQDRARRALS